jgi:hypothetical protein
MRIPTDYLARLEAARATNPAMVENYIAHTTIGDPLADAALAAMADLDPHDSHRLLEVGLENPDPEALAGAPEAVRAFFNDARSVPAWAAEADFRPGIRMFHRNSQLILGAMVGGTLVEGFATNISKSFFITGRLREHGVRRLQQNNRHMVEIFIPGGLELGGDGWKLSVRVRLVHGQIRKLLAESDDWDEEAWGVPISAAHVGHAITAFSARLLEHLKSLGGRFDDAERASFMQVWRYSGYLMGIPESILYESEEDALELFRVGTLCEPEPGMESVAMANSLVNSAPLIAGITEAKERGNLAKYIYAISRALIGSGMANQLRYPYSPTIGVLTWFRLQKRYARYMGWIVPGYAKSKSFDEFTSLLEVSAFDEAGISYHLPDHVYDEESTWW